MKYAFVGYGELGKQLHGFIQPGHQNEYIFFDDELYKKKVPYALPFDNYRNDKYTDYTFILSLGYKNLSLKQNIFNELRTSGRNIFGYLHPSCFINDSVIIGKGVIVYPMCNIDKDVEIGNSVILNNSVVVSHNSVIGASCYLSPGVVVSGFVNMGDNTFVGTGSVISNNITIGKNVFIGIGSVVTHDIPENKFVIGNPMRYVKSININ